MLIKKCEICDETFIAGYGYSLAINWLVTGHAHVAAFMCEEAQGGQHWGCTPEHAMQAIEICLREHMHIDKLIEKHQAVEMPRYAREDEHWAKNKGEKFHIVEIKGEFNGR